MKKNKDKNRQYRSNQGRSPERQSNTEKIMMWTIIGFIIFLIISVSL